MSEHNPVPQLSMMPAAPVPEADPAPVQSIQQSAAPAVEEAPAVPSMDDSQLTDAEKKPLTSLSARLISQIRIMYCFSVLTLRNASLIFHRPRWTPLKRRTPVKWVRCWLISFQS